MFRLITLGGLHLEDRTAASSELRPRLLALLAALAASGRKGATRDQLYGILWADNPPERARHNLTQALYSLRRELGAVVAGTTHLRLDPSIATSDVEDFRTAIADQQWERAAALFRGPFLDGFFLSDAACFERWAEEERTRLTHDAFRAIEAAARDATSGGRLDAALAHWRRLTTLDPLNGRFASYYIEALVATGDRTAALLHAESHSELVRRELDVPPDAAVVAFIESARATAVALPRIRPAAPAAQPVVAATNIEPQAPRGRVTGQRRWIGVALVAIVGALGASQLSTRSRPAAPTTASAVAKRLHEDGVRAFYRFDFTEARRLFDASLANDSSSVMPAYFAWRTEAATGGSRQDTLAERALTLAKGANDRDRLLIVTDIEGSRRELAALATAESLATRYRLDPEALTVAASVIPDHARAVALLNAAIRLDSANARAGTDVVCHSCAALNVLADRYDAADSLTAVERTLARWSALRPEDYQPWRMLAELQISQGLRRDALGSLKRADSLGAPHVDMDDAALERALRFDDLTAADSTCRTALATSSADALARRRTLCAIALRMQGRHRDALRLVRDGRVPWSTETQAPVPLDRMHAATLDMAMERPSSAMLSFLQLAQEDARDARRDARKAHALVWELTLGATASALAGDTIRVRALIDSVEHVGQRSLDARDSHLHHFLHGILLSQSGEHAQAVREYRAAMSSPSRGYNRINYELAKSLIALRRPTEAAAVIRSALRGRFDESSLHLTRIELHEIAAQAFDAAGERDSAAAHYAIVARAWRSADPSLAARYAAAQRGVAGSTERK